MERCSALLRNCLLVLLCAGVTGGAILPARRPESDPPSAVRPAQFSPVGGSSCPRASNSSPAAGPFGLAVSPEGKTVVTANGGPGRNSLTILEHDKNRHWDVRHLLARTKGDDRRRRRRRLAQRLHGHRLRQRAFRWVSEGNSGKIASSIGTARRPTAGGAPSISIRRATTTATPAIWRSIPNAACSTSWIRPISGSP